MNRIDHTHELDDCVVGMQSQNACKRLQRSKACKRLQRFKGLQGCRDPKAAKRLRASIGLQKITEIQRVAQGCRV